MLRTPIEEIVYVTPHFGASHLVRGYHISGYKTPQPVLRTIFYVDILSTYLSPLRSFVRTCRSTLAVRDMVAGYEPSEAKAKCPESVLRVVWPSGRRENEVRKVRISRLPDASV